MQPKRRATPLRSSLGLKAAVTSGVILAASYALFPEGSIQGVTSVVKRWNQPVLCDSSGVSKSFSSSSIIPNKNVKTFSVSEAGMNKKLREFEESFLVSRGNGVLRYDICQLPSNNPIEDDRSEKTIQVPVSFKDSKEDVVNSDWMFWGVYDGHSGWTTSAKLRDSLIDYVIKFLSSDAYVPGKESDKSMPYRVLPASPQAVDNALKKAFLELDDDIVNKNIKHLLDNVNSVNRNSVADLILPALSGSCGLLTFFDSSTKSLRVAVTGDSRVVLGSKDDKGRWTAKALSIDQTGSNPREVARLRSEHPGEPNVVSRGRILGSLEPSRAFGDAKYKWTKDIQERIAQNFFGQKPPIRLQSPPYVTAEPEVTNTKITPNDKFIVIGSDGLYELLSNEEIVGLVAKWMETKPVVPKGVQESAVEVKDTPAATSVSSTSTSTSTSTNKNSSWFGLFNRSSFLPDVKDITTDYGFLKQPFRRGKGNYVIEDENVATHLIRNALGGGDKEQVGMLLSVPSPQSRRYRDDLTVTVVFFGDEESPKGLIEVNKAATRSTEPAPKL